MNRDRIMLDNSLLAARMRPLPKGEPRPERNALQRLVRWLRIYVLFGPYYP
jgi:hypothetical protein